MKYFLYLSILLLAFCISCSKNECFQEAGTTTTFEQREKIPGQEATACVVKGIFKVTPGINITFGEIPPVCEKFGYTKCIEDLSVVTKGSCKKYTVTIVCFE